MRRRYTVERYLRTVERLADFNLTADVIVGFPAEDEAAFERTVETVRAARLTKLHVFPYSPRPGTSTAADDPVAPAVKKERSARLRALSDEACRARWRGEDRRRGRRARRPARSRATAPTTRPGSSRRPSASSCACAAVPSRRRGSSLPETRSARTVSSASSPARASTSRRATASLRSTTSIRRPRRTCSSSRSATSTPSATSPSSRPRRRSGCSTSSPRPRAAAGLEDYRVLVNVGPGGGQTIFHLHWHILGGKIRGMPRR